MKQSSRDDAVCMQKYAKESKKPPSKCTYIVEAREQTQPPFMGFRREDRLRSADTIPAPRLLEKDPDFFRWLFSAASTDKQGVSAQTSKLRISKKDPSSCLVDKDGLSNVKHGELDPCIRS